jgi:hypothetical protein
VRLLVFTAFLLIPGWLHAQAPRIGVIDFYGLQKLQADDLLRVLGVKEGDPLPPSKGDLEERLEQLENVVWASTEAVCCLDGNAILYVGVEERGSPHFSYLESPQGKVELPRALVEAYQAFMEELRGGALRGTTEGTTARSEALRANPRVAEVRRKMLLQAAENSEQIRRVLRESWDPRQRSAAAYLAMHVRRPHDIVDPLQLALRDPDDTVRSNALWSLVALGRRGQADPELGINVQPTWLAEMLYSVLWRDRRDATLALEQLTETRDPMFLRRLEERGVTALLEMGRWKHLEHSLPAYLVLGRVAGIPEDELQAKWSDGQRDEVLARIAEQHRKRR